MKIDRDLLKELNWPGIDYGPWTCVSAEIIGSWRHGTIRETVLRHTDTEAKLIVAPVSYWSITFQVQEGDNYYNSLDDEGPEIELTQVYPHQTIITEYKETPPDATT